MAPLEFWAVSYFLVKGHCNFDEYFEYIQASDSMGILIYFFLSMNKNFLFACIFYFYNQNCVVFSVQNFHPSE